MRCQTFPDKNNRRNVVPARQLASCIDKQAVKFLRPASRDSFPDRSQIAFTQFSFDFVCPLNMTWRQNQKQIGKFRSEPAKNVNQNLFLASMGATPKENWNRFWLTFFAGDRKSTRLNSSHVEISYAVFCLKKKKKEHTCKFHIQQ